MIGTKHIIGWAKNRVGLMTSPDELPCYVRNSLVENKKGPDFADTFGKKDFFGIVGFIDLKGYSSFAYKKTGKEISEFIGPFLTSVIQILTEQSALIDKTIGDEIMFIIPEIENGSSIQFNLIQILRKLKDFVLEEKQYNFRIGISIGNMYLDIINTKEYNEWYISGEPIITAKRLMSVKHLKNPKPCAVAIGSSLKDINLIEALKRNILICEPCKFIPVGRIRKHSAKGIGKVLYHYYKLNSTQ